MKLIIRNKAKPTEKRLCIIRYGAWGDAIMLSPVFKYYKEQGWHITLNCTGKTFEILATNPYIDIFLLQGRNECPKDRLEEHWKRLETQFDKVVNFSGSIETQLLISPQQQEYTWTKEQLKERCDKNYYDETMRWAGFPDKKGERGELYFHRSEENWVKKFKKKHKGFLVLWCITGSSIHKIYPHANTVIQAIVRALPDAKVILVGEPGTKGIIEPHKRIYDYCGRFGIRETLILTREVNLVISTETSTLVGAGCFDTPKIALLSHGSAENVTKYYTNCHVVRENVPCSPCHKLHYVKETCPLHPEFDLPICMAMLNPKKLIAPIEREYIEWKNKNLNGD